jgi:hypothetical protein
VTANIIPLVRVLSKAARLLMGCRQRFVADDVNTRIQEGIGDRCVHMVWSDVFVYDMEACRSTGCAWGTPGGLPEPRYILTGALFEKLLDAGYPADIELV